MKVKNLLFPAISAIMLVSCGSWVRIGDLSSISNRNMDDSKSYFLLNREVEAQADSDNDALEQAVDNLTKQYEKEFLRNAKIFVKSNGKKIKVIGDVWGIRNTAVKVNTSATAQIKLTLATVLFSKEKEI